MKFTFLCPVSKIFWNIATPACLHIDYGYFCTTMAKLRSCLKYLLAIILQKKIANPRSRL